VVGLVGLVGLKVGLVGLVGLGVSPQPGLVMVVCVQTHHMRASNNMAHCIPLKRHQPFSPTNLGLYGFRCVVVRVGRGYYG
jgi:hypothetical protein